MVIEPCPHCDMELDGGDIYTTLKNNTLYTIVNHFGSGAYSYVNNSYGYG
jgi:hypothetical protein